MSKAVLCPVCQGSGEIQETPPAERTSAIPITKVCHGCSGKGWVEVISQEEKYDNKDRIQTMPALPSYCPTGRATE